MPNAISRRNFLKRAAAATGATLAFPYIVPSSVFGANAPSKRITGAAIGLGWQGSGNWGSLRGMLQPVAVCDVDRNHAQAHAGKDCRVYTDYREMLEKEKPDVVTIAVPDNWHAKIATDVMRSGADVYGEKPLARTLREGRAIAEAARRYGRIWQTGSWQRSGGEFQQAVELVRNGRLGKISKVEVRVGGGVGNYGGHQGAPIQAPPPELNYDMWLGPAPVHPYRTNTTHVHWRWVSDFGGGMLMDWIGHHGDIALWALGLDRTGPVSIQGTGRVANLPEWDILEHFDINCTFANGIEMNIGTQGSHAKFYGERGWLEVGRGHIDANPKSILKEQIEAGEIRIGRHKSHWQDFMDCVRTRQETIAPAESAHRAASLGQLGEIAILTGRKLQWNPATEQISNDPAASALLTRPYREPWIL